MLNIGLFKAKPKLLSTVKKEPYGKFVESKHISSEQLKTMYAIYEQYYENTRYSIFEADFLKKYGVILILHPVSHEIVGFSTIALNHFNLEGQRYTFVFSGDTVIMKEFWGCRALQSTFLKLMIKLRFEYPFDNFYWMLISKGYKTYLLLANNYYVYYPHFKGKHGNLKPIVEHYCKKYFAEYFDAKTGLLNFGSDYQPLKGEVAPITDRMRRDNPKINFFENQNPSWKDGTELPCVGELSWKSIARYPMRYFTKPTSKGKQEAVYARAQLAGGRD
jgi:hypothetical protein